jgi:hypothetical protein
VEDVLDELHDRLDVAEDLRLGLRPRIGFPRSGGLVGGGEAAELAVDAERESRHGGGGGGRREAPAEEARGGPGEGGGQGHGCLGAAATNGGTTHEGVLRGFNRFGK